VMYTITRGPSKLATQRRTGQTQQLDNKINDLKHKPAYWTMPDLPAPKIVFSRPNGRKYHQPAPGLPSDLQDDSLTPAHQQNVRFVHEAWQEVLQQEQGPEEPRGAVHYKEATSSPHIDNFVPLDLDEWWAQRFLANIDKLS
uniref:Uncharacterized protein n=1 Tax=Mola mola TaxID=94237 RepID=A0A3Q3WL31_MOLML